MLFYLLLLFTIVPAVELYILLEVGSQIGAANTIMLIIFTGILGATLARLQGFIVLNKIQQNLNKGLMPSAELIDGLMILVGGIVLLTPGFVTDALGFVLLIPWTRSLIKYIVKNKFEHVIKKGEAVHFRDSGGQQKSPDGYDDIDL